MSSECLTREQHSRSRKSKHNSCLSKQPYKKALTDKRRAYTDTRRQTDTHTPRVENLTENVGLHKVTAEVTGCSNKQLHNIARRPQHNPSVYHAHCPCNRIVGADDGKTVGQSVGVIQQTVGVENGKATVQVLDVDDGKARGRTVGVDDSNAMERVVGVDDGKAMERDVGVDDGKAMEGVVGMDDGKTMEQVVGIDGGKAIELEAKRADTSAAWISSIFLVMNLMVLLRIFFALSLSLIHI